jgi:hypothetical protein
MHCSFKHNSLYEHGFLSYANLINVLIIVICWEFSFALSVILCSYYWNSEGWKRYYN